jgi:hypothetical protein
MTFYEDYRNETVLQIEENTYFLNKIIQSFYLSLIKINVYDLK